MDQAEYERVLEEIWDKFGEGPFQSARSDGQAMNLNQAVLLTTE